MAGLRLPHHRIQVSASMQADLEVWLQVFQSFNGVSFWRTKLQLEAELQIKSDATGTLGFEVYFRRHWCTKAWPAKWAATGVRRDLTFLELFPILVAVCLWGMASHSVHFWCDKMAVVQVLNALTSRSPRVMDLIWHLILRCLRLNMLF